MRRRNVNALAVNLTQRWDARCGEPSTIESERVEVTGRWANGELLHSSHRVRVAGVRSRGCVHAKPQLDWAPCDQPDYWMTVCRLPNCQAGMPRTRTNES